MRVYKRSKKRSSAELQQAIHIEVSKQDGRSMQEIADHLGVTKTTIWNYFHKNGLHSIKINMSEDEYSLLMNAAQSGGIPVGMFCKRALLQLRDVNKQLTSQSI